MKSQSVVVLSLLVASFLLLEGVSGGGWTEIKDLDDPLVHEIAEFAVAEHNKKANTDLVPQELVKGEMQSGGGSTTYRVTIVVRDGKVSKRFEAVVGETNKGVRTLTSFQQV
ncbi:PREDICTED: cysteine proteinase inhibitor 1-like [Nelumbo nucifera]|uniref:Cystatin domain-containing protein n=2 Tax=Nelumbo nucifera TaxID=4432 RepID=A0A822Z728_NELNU|nr:PREDICTED: cysteine proteinase inhibitor 1-like [Nelumbo nucifera]DAD39255.1 TPA_asm: hypothetical protein HUJ06_013578 [Nelumbo nucifera]